MTPKQALVAHMRDTHGFSRPAGTYKVLTANHKGHHDRNDFLTHRHRIERWDEDGVQILDVADIIEQRIFLSPPKNPSATRNQDRNWCLNITYKGGGYRYEMPGTWEGDPEGAKTEANKILGYDANWVAVGWGFQHQDKETA